MLRGRAGAAPFPTHSTLHHVPTTAEVLVRHLAIFFRWLQAVLVVVPLQPHKELLCFSSTRTVKMLQLL